MRCVALHAHDVQHGVGVVKHRAALVHDENHKGQYIEKMG